MDKITREAKEHDDIMEFIAIYQGALAEISYRGPWNRIKELHNFLNDRIPPHFEFEEKEIFPSLMEKGMDKEKRLVQELLTEHTQIRDKLAKFDTLLSEYSSPPKEEETYKLSKKVNEILITILEHAQAEDKKLFPILQEFEIDLKG